MKTNKRRVWLARVAVVMMLHRLTLAGTAVAALLCVLGVYAPESDFAHLKAHAPWMAGLALAAALWYVWKRRGYEEMEGRTSFIGALFLDSVVVLVAFAGWVHGHFGAAGISAFVAGGFVLGLGLDLAQRRAYRQVLGLDEAVIG